MTSEKRASFAFSPRTVYGGFALVGSCNWASFLCKDGYRLKAHCCLKTALALLRRSHQQCENLSYSTMKLGGF